MAPSHHIQVTATHLKIGSNLQVPNLQMSNSNSPCTRGYQTLSLAMAARQHIHHIQYIHCWSSMTYHWLSGKLWYLQHNCVGDTIVYHKDSNITHYTHHVNLSGAETRIIHVKYSSISWLLMPWLLVSTSHQQPWYWLYKLNMSLSFMR